MFTSIFPLISIVCAGLAVGAAFIVAGAVLFTAPNLADIKGTAGLAFFALGLAIIFLGLFVVTELVWTATRDLR